MRCGAETVARSKSKQDRKTDNAHLLLSSFTSCFRIAHLGKSQGQPFTIALAVWRTFLVLLDIYLARGYNFLSCCVAVLLLLSGSSSSRNHHDGSERHRRGRG